MNHSTRMTRGAEDTCFSSSYILLVCARALVCVGGGAVRGQLEEVGSSPFHLYVTRGIESGSPTRGIESGSPALQGPLPGNHLTA